LRAATLVAVLAAGLRVRCAEAGAAVVVFLAGGLGTDLETEDFNDTFPTEALAGGVILLMVAMMFPSD